MNVYKYGISGHSNKRIVNLYRILFYLFYYIRQYKVCKWQMISIKQILTPFH